MYKNVPVSEDLKKKIQFLKIQLNVKSEGEVVERLLEAYNAKEGVFRD